MKLENGKKNLNGETYKCKTDKCLYDFQQFETIRYFGDSTYTGKIDIDEAEIDQSNLLENMAEINKKSNSKTKEGKAKTQNTFDSVNAFYEGRELTLNAFRIEILPIKAAQWRGRPSDLLTLKQMLQRLSIVLA